jgi:hypothetical protein
LAAVPGKDDRAADLPQRELLTARDELVPQRRPQSGFRKLASAVLAIQEVS